MRTNRYSDSCGPVRVTVTPVDDDRSCGGKDAVKIRVASPSGTSWSPRSPMCVPYDPYTSKGKKRAMDEAVDFYEHYNCGRDLSGPRRRRRRPRR